jgi:Leucine-rich repeat (LRR) protein
LRHNNLRGPLPESILNATELAVLNLAGNFLTGEIPVELYTLERLEVLDLSQNNLEGEIHGNVLGLVSLRQMRLNSNFLAGQIPWSIGYLSDLNVLLLQQNNLTGDLPASLPDLLNVTKWDLTSNQFNPTAYLPYPLCPLCNRFISKKGSSACNQTAQGYLLSCSSARTFVSRRDPESFGRVRPLPEMKSIMQRVPESCVYRYPYNV